MDTRSHTFSKERLDEFRQIFEFYDVDNNRIMDMGDLDVALRALGFSPSESEVEDVIALMDVDGDKTIDFTEFCMIIEYLQFKKGKYGELREAFRSLDLCNEGLVLEDDVTQMLTSHAKEMTLKEINDLIRFTKTDELDTINYSKFVDAVEKADCDKNNDKDEDTFK
uniref:EF-hand domain-containing protein n=2 Tax=Ciona intestinalis TaxID=7719 RepID=F6RE33_CIOIN